MSYKKGDIVVVKFPFILKEKMIVQKGRPALIISDDKVERRYKDFKSTLTFSDCNATFSTGNIARSSRVV